ncbi:hypothetical protein BASA81_001919 [Batrachochytrium salamandrivorans]|nr:hypothetical protein BASA81_001919 [Batrachochytrium salamandrivorans]
MSSSLVRQRVYEFREVVSKLQENDSAPVVLLTTKRLGDLNSSLQTLLDTSIAEQKLAIRSQLRAEGSKNASLTSPSFTNPIPLPNPYSAPGPLVSYFQRSGQNLSGVDELLARKSQLHFQLTRAKCSSKHWQVCLVRCANIFVSQLPTSNVDNCRRLPAWIRQEMEHFCQQCFLPLCFYGLDFPCFDAQYELEEEDLARLGEGLEVSHQVFAQHHLVYLFKAVVQPVVVQWTSALLTSDKLSEQEFRHRINLVLPLVRFLPQVGLVVAKLFTQFAEAEHPTAEDMVEWRLLLSRFKILI